MCNPSSCSSASLYLPSDRAGHILAAAFLITGFLGSAGAGELRSAWTRDAFAPSRGVLRPVASVPSVGGVLPALDSGALVQFREFRPGELQVDELAISGGSWSCLKLTNAVGRPANGCHFVELDASVLREVSHAQALVSGLVLGPKATRHGDLSARETIKYVVPKAQEAWFLGELARVKVSTATVMRLEKEAFARAASGQILAGTPARPLPREPRSSALR